MGSKKGGVYERQICTELSMWWSDSADDDLFWRTSGSGGRATRRRKVGKTTVGHCGDVGATDERGIPLLKVMAIEIKRGYNKFTFADMLDKPKKAAVQQWEGWVHQAVEAQENSGALSWLLIQKRDQRDPICFMPNLLVNELCVCGAFQSKARPMVTINFRCGMDALTVTGMKLKSFLKGVDPEHVRLLCQRSSL